MTDAAFVVPTSPMGAWEQLSENEKTWIEFIRVISGGRDPKITTDRVRKLREVLDAGSGVWRASGSPRRRCTHLQTSTQHGDAASPPCLATASLRFSSSTCARICVAAAVNSSLPGFNRDRKPVIEVSPFRFRALRFRCG